MKVMRPFVWAAVMVAAFLFVTSVGRWDIWKPMTSVGRLWTEPASAASVGGYTSDEQNNIDIYRSAHDATVETPRSWGACHAGEQTSARNHSISSRSANSLR